jgi:hypothetical protein
MRRRIAVALLIFTPFPVVVSVAQRATSALYDSNAPITLTGAYAGTGYGGSGPLYLFVEVLKDGRNEKWAIEGDSLLALRKNGWKKDIFAPPIAAAEVITVQAYRPKASAKAISLVPDYPDAPGLHSELSELAKLNRLVRGTEILLANGTRLYFGQK